MRSKSSWVTFVLLVVLLAACRPDAASRAPLRALRSDPSVPQSSSAAVQKEPLRVFWANSYDGADAWALQIRTGLWEALARSGYSIASGTLTWESVDLGFSQLSSAVDLASRVDQTVDTILDFEPDVVIVSDDEAVQALVPRLPLDAMNVVLCGLNSPVESVGTDEMGTGVAVVAEPLRPVQTVAMAREFAGSDDRNTGSSGSYLLIADASLTGTISASVAYETLVRSGMGAGLRQGIADTWEAWQSLVLREAPNVDFVVVASYRPLPDMAAEAADTSHRSVGGNHRAITSREMMTWMLETLDIPVFSLVNAVVIEGAVGGLVADGYEQGRLAGEMAIRVAHNPSVEAGAGSGVFATWTATGPSRLVVNAAAARHWGLTIPALFPIAAEVYRSLPALSSEAEAPVLPTVEQLGLAHTTGPVDITGPVYLTGPEGGQP